MLQSAVRCEHINNKDDSVLFLTRICHFLRMRTLIRRSPLILCSLYYVLEWHPPRLTGFSLLKIVKQIIFSQLHWVWLLLLYHRWFFFETSIVFSDLGRVHAMSGLYIIDNMHPLPCPALPDYFIILNFSSDQIRSARNWVQLHSLRSLQLPRAARPFVFILRYSDRIVLNWI